MCIFRDSLKIHILFCSLYFLILPAPTSGADFHSFSLFQTFFHIKNSLIGASAVDKRQIPLCFFIPSIDQNVNSTKQFLLFFCSVIQFLKRISGIACHFVSFFMQKLRKLCKARCLCKRLSSGKCDTFCQRIRIYAAKNL